MIRTRTARLFVPLLWLACEQGSPPASAQAPPVKSPPIAQPKMAAPEAVKPVEKAAAQSQSGELLALDGNRKVQILKGAAVELRCLQNKPKERGCLVNLQVRVERDGKRISLTSGEAVLPSPLKDKREFGIGNAGQSTLDLIPISQRGGALIRIKTQADGGRVQKQALTAVTWYILELREPAGASTFKPVLNYEENMSSTHEDEENTRIKMATATTVEQKKTSCRGFPDVLLRTTERVTRGGDSPEKNLSESLYRWDGTEYARATGQPAPECSQTD